MNTHGLELGEVVPYRTTRSTIKMTKITEFEEVSPGVVWHRGVSVETKKHTWYPCHLSASLKKQQQINPS